MLEGQYNLSEHTGKFAEVLVGANYKQYNLNSQGTLFADGGGVIGIKELGTYIQASKNLFKEFLKLSLTGRYDKNENFKGRFTPRATALFRVAENKNIRFSFQSAYRFPSTQQQWIDLDIGSNTRLLGGVPYFQQKYNLNGNSYQLSSLPSVSTPYTITPFKPESVNTLEFGYKGLAMDSKLLIDLYGYYGQYQDFLSRILLVKPKSTFTLASIKNAIATNTSVSNVADIYSIPVNSTEKVKTSGFGASLGYQLPYGFLLNTNFSSDNLNNVPAGFVAYFNTPKYRANVSFGNTGFGVKKLVGFNVSYRWQEAFSFEGDFANDNLPEIYTVDAQISLKLPSTKAVVKIGANNLLNQYYVNAVGNSIIGGLYYVSFGYNVL